MFTPPSSLPTTSPNRREMLPSLEDEDVRYLGNFSGLERSPGKVETSFESHTSTPETPFQSTPPDPAFLLASRSPSPSLRLPAVGRRQLKHTPWVPLRFGSIEEGSEDLSEGYQVETTTKVRCSSISRFVSAY